MGNNIKNLVGKLMREVLSVLSAVSNFNQESKLKGAKTNV